MKLKKPKLEVKPSFEECLDVIDAEIHKRKYKWNLNSITWMDYDDVSQIIRIHIYNKWAFYDHAKPLQPWLNTVISHKISNLIRDVHTNMARPCLRCDAAIGQTGCKIYTTQCSSCPLYKNWEKKKKSAYNIKMPLPMENHSNEVNQLFDETSDISLQIEKVHDKMKAILKPVEYKVYEGLFILHEDEGIVAKKLGYISNENGRNPGYKQIKNIRKIIIQKFKKCLERGEIDIY